MSTPQEDGRGLSFKTPVGFGDLKSVTESRVIPQKEWTTASQGNGNPVTREHEVLVRGQGDSRRQAWVLIGATAIASAVVPGIWWIQESYFEIDVPASLSYVGADGWCNPATEGIGIHCFGDFSERWRLDYEQPLPWPTNLELTPIGPFLSGFATLISQVIDPRLVLAAVIVLYAACLLVPALWASRNYSWIIKGICLGLFGFATYPFLSAMDRLNVVALLCPLLLLISLAFMRGNALSLAGYVLLAGMVKPQALLLVVLLACLKRLQLAAVTFILGFASIGFLVVLAGGGDMRRLGDYLGAAQGYGSGRLSRMDEGWPTNVSFMRMMYVVSEQLDALLRNWGINLNTTPFVLDNSTLVQIVTTIAFLTLAISIRSSVGRLEVLSVALFATFIVPGEFVAPYYLVFALPVAALMLRRFPMSQRKYTRISDASEFEPLNVEGTYVSPRVHATLTVGVVAALTPIVIPIGKAPPEVFGGLGFDSVKSAGPVLTAISWTVVSVVIGLEARRSWANGRSKDPVVQM